MSAIRVWMLAVVVGGVAGALSGCAGPAVPGASTSSASSAPSATSTAKSKLAPAEVTHEYPSSRPPSQRSSSAAPSPVDAIRVFAIAYINWNAQTVSADMRVLAALSIGQARSAMQLAAANTAQDYELRRGGIANSGTVEAVAPLDGGTRGRFVVVTRERTTATNTTSYQGLRPAWHLTLATVARVGPGRWALSGWQPEN